jgi:hypothetical protein
MTLKNMTRVIMMDTVKLIKTVGVLLMKNVILLVTLTTNRTLMDTPLTRMDGKPGSNTAKKIGVNKPITLL